MEEKKLQYYTNSFLSRSIDNSHNESFVKNIRNHSQCVMEQYKERSIQNKRMVSANVSSAYNISSNRDDLISILHRCFSEVDAIVKKEIHKLQEQIVEEVTQTTLGVSEYFNSKTTVESDSFEKSLAETRKILKYIPDSIYDVDAGEYTYQEKIGVHFTKLQRELTQLIGGHDTAGIKNLVEFSFNNINANVIEAKRNLILRSYKHASASVNNFNNNLIKEFDMSASFPHAMDPRDVFKLEVEETYSLGNLDPYSDEVFESQSKLYEIKEEKEKLKKIAEMINEQKQDEPKLEPGSVFKV